MTRAAIRIIREEHDALARLLTAIHQHLDGHRRAGTRPDFVSLRAMLFYLDEFPEKRHHLKESQLLFTQLRARAPAARRLLDALEEEHLQAGRAIRELEHALIAYDVMGESRRAAFEQAMTRFDAFYRSHIATEDRDVLPWAERVLTEQEWQDLDDAFLADTERDARAAPQALYPLLLEKLLSAQPATDPGASEPDRDGPPA
jgi:hemerythrin-like domain-containing protein